ncbi:MAG: Methyltransferase GidB [Candidatus Parcubacteria bacterium]|jgi:16S rRNA (guanine527-N7)-methyltransferase
MEPLIQYAHTVGITLEDAHIKQFAILLKELQKKNKEFNLTAITEEKDIILKHFIDSLSLVPHIPKNTETLIDIGTGAGFPGLPIKIVRPEIKVTFLEATIKKISFIEHVLTTLSIKNCRTIHTRAEEAGQDLRFREQFDIATARAVAELNVLAEYTLPFLKVGGLFLAQKSTGQEEIMQGDKAIKTLGGEIKNIVPINIEGLENRQLVIIEKVAPTPEKYPRRPGQASKKPIQ